MKISRWQLRLVAIILSILAILSIFQEQFCIKIDAVTIIAICLATLLFITPNLSFLSKLKIGEVEMEFNRELEKLETLVNKEEVTLYTGDSDKKSTNIDKLRTPWEFYYEQYQLILDSSTSNLEKVLRASQLIEKMIIDVGNDLGVTKPNIKSPYAIVRELVNLGLFSPQEFNIYQEYTTLRNKIIHGDATLLDNSLTIRMLDLSSRIIRILG